VVRTSGNDIARAGGEGNISFMVSVLTLGQSVYPDISLHFSNYCVYCIEDQNLTHNLNDHIFFKKSRNLIGTAIKSMLFNLICNQYVSSPVSLFNVSEMHSKFVYDSKLK